MKSFIKLVLSASFFFLLVSFNSCKENKETSSETKLELASAYACPMDCEKGKVYDKTGDCPVCNMKLTPADDAMVCTAHKDGNCKCDGDKCKCANCKEHTKTSTCSAHEDGKCSCDDDKCKCDNCPTHS